LERDICEIVCFISSKELWADAIVEHRVIGLLKVPIFTESVPSDIPWNHRVNELKPGTTISKTYPAKNSLASKGEDKVKNADLCSILT
jgi:hypothetical protein